MSGLCVTWERGKGVNSLGGQCDEMILSLEERQFGKDATVTSFSMFLGLKVAITRVLDLIEPPGASACRSILEQHVKHLVGSDECFFTRFHVPP